MQFFAFLIASEILNLIGSLIIMFLNNNGMLGSLFGTSTT